MGQQGQHGMLGLCKNQQGDSTNMHKETTTNLRQTTHHLHDAMFPDTCHSVLELCIWQWLQGIKFIDKHRIEVFDLPMPTHEVQLAPVDIQIPQNAVNIPCIELGQL